MPNSLNIYGKSKLAGGWAIQSVGGAYLVLRTSRVYSLRRDNFVTKVLGWARKQEKLRVARISRALFWTLILNAVNSG